MKLILCRKQMKKNLLKKTLVFFLLFKAGLSFAQTPSTLLWEISGNGLKSPSFIFGTYHLISSSYIDSFPLIRINYDKTKAVVGEMLIDAEATTKIASAVLMTDSSLTQLLTADEYKLVDDYLKSISGMDLALFNKMKPVVISTFFYSLLLKNENGKAMDIYFQDIAKESGKKVYGLETADQQIAVLFGGSSLRQQAKQLVQAVKDKDKNLEEMRRTNHCYREQDLECLTKALSETSEFTPEEMNKLLYDRNRNWMEKLPAMMLEQPLFIAVGAGHLPGEKGLLTLMKAKGYAVRPVMLR
jgi:hypothetical protein